MANRGDTISIRLIDFADSQSVSVPGDNTLLSNSGSLYYNGTQINTGSNTFNVMSATLIMPNSSGPSVTIGSNLVLRPTTESAMAGQGFQYMAAPDGRLFFEGVEIGGRSNLIPTITSNVILPYLSSNLQIATNLNVSNIFWVNTNNVVIGSNTIVVSQSNTVLQFNNNLSLSGPVLKIVGISDQANLWMQSNDSTNTTGTKIGNFSFVNNNGRHAIAKINVIQSDQLSSSGGGGTLALVTRNPSLNASSGQDDTDTQINMITCKSSLTGNTIYLGSGGDTDNVYVGIGRSTPSSKFEVYSQGNSIFSVDSVNNKAVLGTSTILQFVGTIAIAGGAGADRLQIGTTTAGLHSTAFGVSSDASGANTVAIGWQAGATGVDSVAVGNQAGQTAQNSSSVSIGSQAGQTSQGSSAVSVGYQAGQTSQGSSAVSIGYQAGQTSQGSSSVSIGYQTGLTRQGSSAISIGNSAGQTSQGSSTVSVGYQAGQTSQETNSISVGNSAGQSAQGSVSVAIGYQAGQTSQGSLAIALGSQAGQTFQFSNAIAIGILAGQVRQNVNSIAIGSSAGQSGQNVNSIAIGQLAGQIGQYSNSIAIGSSAGLSNQGSSSISLGLQAGAYNQSSNSLAIGNFAGRTSQGNQALSIGLNAGNYRQSSNSVAIGSYSGVTSQGSSALAICVRAGEISQGTQAIAIGEFAGQSSQLIGSIALGYSAGQINQSSSSVAIGLSSGQSTQSSYAVAVGHQTGQFNQSFGAVSVGYQAGQSNQGKYSIAVGYQAGRSHQADYSIVLNALGTSIPINTPNSFFVTPIRNAPSTSASSVLSYNELTYEVYKQSMLYTSPVGVGINNTAPSNLLCIGVNNQFAESGLSLIGNVTASAFYGSGLNLSNTTGSTVPSSTYGSGSQVPVINIDSDGKISSITNTNITYAGTLQQVTEGGNTTSNTVQFTNSGISLITNGNIGIANSTPSNLLCIGDKTYFTNSYANVMITTGNISSGYYYGNASYLYGTTDLVPSTTYGSSTTTPQISIDSFGRITTITPIAVSITATLDQVVSADPTTTHSMILTNQTAFTTTGNVGIANSAPSNLLCIGNTTYFTQSEFITSGNVTATNYYGSFKGSINSGANNISSSNYYGNVVGSNTINASTISATNYYGGLSGSNTINASTISSTSVSATNLYGAFSALSNTISSKSVITGANLYGNIIGSNTISASTIYGSISGSNTIAGSTITGSTLVGTLYGPISGSNTINASTISATTYYGNISGSNTISLSGSGAFYGNINGSNTINASLVSATTLSGNITGATVISSATFYGAIAGSNNISVILPQAIYGAIAGSNNISCGTLYGSILGSNTILINNTIASSNYFGNIIGSNTINASTISATTLYGSFSGLSNTISSKSAITGANLYGNVVGSNTINASTISATTLYGAFSGLSNTISTKSTITGANLYGNVVGSNTISGLNLYGNIVGSNTISASTILATTVTSNLTGIASTAQTVNVVNANSTGNYDILMSNTAGVNSNQPAYNVSLNYTPSTSTLASPNFSGNLIGTASNSNAIQTYTVASGTYNVPFVLYSNASQNLYTDNSNLITYTPDTAILTSPYILAKNIPVYWNSEYLYQGYTPSFPSAASNTYYQLSQLPATNDNGNDTCQVLTGVLSSWTGGSANLLINFRSRGAVTAIGSILADNISIASLVAIMDIVIYTDAGISTVYLVVKPSVYYYFDFTISGLSRNTLNILYQPTSGTTTVPSGTLTISSVVSQLNFTNLNGALTTTSLNTTAGISSATTISGSNLYGNVIGSNTINASTISATTLYGNISGSNIISLSTPGGFYGNILGSNVCNAVTYYGSALNMTGTTSASAGTYGVGSTWRIPQIVVDANKRISAVSDSIPTFNQIITNWGNTTSNIVQFTSGLFAANLSVGNLTGIIAASPLSVLHSGYTSSGASVNIQVGQNNSFMNSWFISSVMADNNFNNGGTNANVFSLTPYNFGTNDNTTPLRITSSGNCYVKGSIFSPKTFSDSPTTNSYLCGIDNTYKIVSSATTYMDSNSNIVGSRQITPALTTTYNLGTSSLAWLNVYSQNFPGPSDINLKKNISQLKHGLSELSNIETIRFQWKNQTDNEYYYGVKAQQIQELLPELIFQDDATGPLMIDYRELIPVCINAIQELNNSICKGVTSLINGNASVILNDNTFTQFFLQNTTTFDRVIGNITDNILQITCENTSSNSMINWMVTKN